ncbi:MAG: phage baseplate assembly protein V [Campylobacteraceae bacterium]|jgi:phage baseplate assembly protein V|nr:phage baseplate assembly protein V [Campylobacteraceae bacterium]
MNFLIEAGLISEVSANQTKARVQIAGGLVTDFLHILQLAANSYKIHFIPAQVLEQVIVLSTENDINSGVILRGLNYIKFPVPKDASESKEIIEYADGTVISYDTKTKTLTAAFAGDVKINIEGSANITVAKSAIVEAQNISAKAGTAEITCPETSVKGNVTVDGIVTATGVVGNTVTVGGAGGSVMKAEGGKFKIDRPLDVTGDVKASGGLLYDKFGAIRTQDNSGGGGD